MKQYTLEATPVASAKQLKDQKTPKAKRIAVGSDVHLRGYQAARKVDNAAIGAVANFRSETELLLYVEKQCEPGSGGTAKAGALAPRRRAEKLRRLLTPASQKI